MKNSATEESARIVFCLALALLACHEIDAVARREWRMLIFLDRLDDADGLKAFMLIHIPLFTALFWLTAHPSTHVRFASQLGVDAFLAIHAILHFSLSGHALYEFEPPVETITVYGGAAAGVVHATLLLARRRKWRRA